MKRAFTLTETLMTLGIIGVIAAMTLPALMTNIRHKIVAARLKKFYSTMEQMFILAEDENGTVNTWDNKLPFSDFYDTYFLPYIKAEKGTTYNENDTLFLQDGSKIILLAKSGCLDFDYDYNGNTGPNKEGYDRFRFLFCRKGQDLYGCEEGFCPFFYGPTQHDRSRDRVLHYCKLFGQYCSALLFIDHWEFLPDYPY